MGKIKIVKNKFQVKFYSDNFSPYAKEVQELLKTTNLRIHFTELHTLGDENLQTHQGIKVHRLIKPQIKSQAFLCVFRKSARTFSSKPQ